MRRSALLAAPVFTAFAVFAAVGGSPAAGRDRPTVASGFRLQLFESCDEMLAYTREHTLRMAGPNGLPEPQRGIAFEYGNSERNRELIRTAPLASWLPSYEVRRGGANSGERRYLVQCKHVWRPRTFSGLGLLTVATIDLDRGLEPTNTVALLRTDTSRTPPRPAST